MLIWSVVAYLVVSIAIGLFVARKVRNTKDFAMAGRSLPLPVIMATTFATWFGAETVFGVSSTFLKDGLAGIVADPFGAGMCLIFAGIFFGLKLYKLNIMTLGDFFRMRYNRTVEVVTTLCIVTSYLGWVSAQVKALGLIFSVLTEGAITQEAGIVIGAVIVLTYTTVGGMLSVAILDFVQMIMIIFGLSYIAYTAADMAGSASFVVNHALESGKLEFFPEGKGAIAWLSFFGTWITMALGSIPQQDVFQRITSAKSAKTAIYGSVMGGSFYILFAFVPIFAAYAATLINPDIFGNLVTTDAEQVLPVLVLKHMPVFAQIIFYGAVLSAIMSTSSATLLAPSVAFSENILRAYFPQISDRSLLRMMRLTILGFAVFVLCFSLFSDNTIFGMVENAYKITLAGAFVPLFVGAYWKRATTQGALFSIFGGLSVWLFLDITYGEDFILPPQLIGFFASLVGIVLGTYLPQWFGLPKPTDAAQIQ